MSMPPGSTFANIKRVRHIKVPDVFILEQRQAQMEHHQGCVGR